MPLEAGKSQDVISRNIETEISAGRPPEQAAAIAYSNARSDADGASTPCAGIMFVCGDKVLLLKRSGEGDCPGQWSFPGGKMEPGETPEQAAIRECIEEMGSCPEGQRFPFARRNDGSSDYITFRQDVESQFNPVLNDEHDGFAWVTIEPLLAGMAITTDEFKESDHPRDEDGKFCSGGGGGDGGDHSGGEQNLGATAAPKSATSSAAAPDITQTKEFKAWFKGSKVKNEDGTPKMMFHGTAGEFDEFDEGMQGTNTDYSGSDRAFFFAASENESHYYAQLSKDRLTEEANNQNEEFSGKARIIRSYVDLKRPLIIKGSPDGSSVKGATYERLADDDAEALDYAREKGYDGIIWTAGNMNNSGYTVAVFDPDKIKIVDHGTGTKADAAPVSTPAPVSPQPSALIPQPEAS